jgi:hypothetical protein
MFRAFFVKKILIKIIILYLLKIYNHEISKIHHINFSISFRH